MALNGVRAVWYNSACLSEQNTQGALLLKAAPLSQSGIVGKVPSINGFRPVLAVRLDNGSAICGGHFAVEMKSCGVYALVFHTDHGEMIYVGSTVQSFQQRLWGHIHNLRFSKHHSPRLQNLYNKYGKPEFRILEVCPDMSETELRQREQFWIDQIETSKLVNFGPALPSPRLGSRHTPNARAKMGEAISKSLKGIIHTPEHRAKLSAATKGRKKKPLTDEHREKLSAAGMGRECPPETRAKISAAQKGRKLTPEFREKLSAAHKGKSNGPLSTETKAKISAAQKGKKDGPLSAEHKLKLSIAGKGKKPSTEVREKISVANKGKIRTPEAKEKMSAAHKGIPLSQEHRAALKAGWARKKAEHNGS